MKLPSWKIKTYIETLYYNIRPYLLQTVERSNKIIRTMQIS